MIRSRLILRLQIDALMTQLPKTKLFATAALILSLATASAAPQATVDAEQKEVTAFRLNMDNVEKFGAATLAVQKLAHDNPALKKQMDEDSKNKTMQETISNIEQKFPAVAAAMRGAGLSAHDYVIMGAAIVSTTMAVGMKKQGALKQIPPSVSPENAAFVEQNYDKISAMLQKMTNESR
jgi:hypothetical protein